MGAQEGVRRVLVIFPHMFPSLAWTATCPSAAKKKIDRA